MTHVKGSGLFVSTVGLGLGCMLGLVVTVVGIILLWFFWPLLVIPFLPSDAGQPAQTTTIER